MSKYHRNCYVISNINEDLILCHRQNLKNRKDFVQTTKELYIPVAPTEENPAYKHYFNTYFIYKWKCRTDAESNKAGKEYAKFSMDVDNDHFMKLPPESNSFYWIPDQFSPWKWGGSDDSKCEEQNHEALFERYSKSVKKPQLNEQKKHQIGKRTGTQKLDYKILIN